jgi:peptidoglycan/xylan/chitin deacetylase (PgdA/CDA1 family)
MVDLNPVTASSLPLRPPFRGAPLLATGLAILTVAWSDEIAYEADPTPEIRVDALHEVRHPHVRESLRGTAFPEGVLALTWDDGPDRHTLDLARFLKSRRVTGTFFVVRAWEEGISEEPGRGRDRFATGYGHLPILGDLVALGHRIGNHTDEHVVVSGLSEERVVEQLGRNQTALDPFLANELRMFRTPGGYWSDSASIALDRPAFDGTIGPLRWDIDEKDWSAPIDGLSARVVAQRYLATALRLKRGIVLLHDRVGTVGSSFPLELAKELVPALEARGFVFAAPILSFTAFEPRLAVGGHGHDGLRLGDLDGDGRADVCVDTPDASICARSIGAARPSGALPRTSFVAPRAVARSVMGDIDGDGRADRCAVRRDEVVCARGGGLFETWSTSLGARGDGLVLADVDGDGRADACVRNVDGVTCATSTGSAFGTPRTWIDASAIDAAHVELGDVDGDGRADACSAGVCALSMGRAFGAPTRWSSAKELASSAERVRFGDLNGDGRADACAPTAEGVACALSNGRSFTAPSLWLDRRVAAFELGDVNADGRADLCAVVDGNVNCALAP